MGGGDDGGHGGDHGLHRLITQLGVERPRNQPLVLAVGDREVRRLPAAGRAGVGGPGQWAEVPAGADIARLAGVAECGPVSGGEAVGGLSTGGGLQLLGKGRVVGARQALRQLGQDTRQVDRRKND